jgi:hypothetical protein
VSRAQRGESQSQAEEVPQSEEDAMKYLYTFIGDDSDRPSTPEEMKEGIERWSAFDREAVDAGVLIACEPLEPNSAVTIRVAGDGQQEDPTDGPFAESKEQLGGFALLDVKDRDEALAWAEKIPLRPGASMEVWPILDLSEYGYESATVSPAKAKATA